MHQPVLGSRSKPTPELGPHILALGERLGWQRPRPPHVVPSHPMWMENRQPSASPGPEVVPVRDTGGSLCVLLPECGVPHGHMPRQRVRNAVSQASSRPAHSGNYNLRVIPKHRKVGSRITGARPPSTASGFERSAGD